jgi:hypothetical protein
MSSINPLYPPSNKNDFSQDFNNREKLKHAMETISQVEKPVLVSTSVQNQLIEQKTGMPVNNPYSVGKALLQHVPRTETPLDKSIFYGHYIDKKVAEKQLSTTQINTDNVLKKFYSEVPSTTQRCRTFAPLRLRYDSKGDSSDKVLSIVVLKGGELKQTSKVVPDIVMTFHGVEGTITLTLCFINDSKMNDLMIAITSLYALDYKTSVSISDFSKLYDKVRYNVLRQQVLHN